MSEAGAAVARYAFTSGPQRGSHLTLYVNCVVHRSEDVLETIPLAGLASVRVAFVHDPNRVVWGAVAIIVAAVLFAISSPLATVAESAAADVAGNTSVVGAAARGLPYLAFLGGLGGAALAALGWYGVTILTLSFAGGTREYRILGRKTALVDFGEAISQKLMQLKR